MKTERFDIVIIGSGAGGGTMAHALAGTGASLLLVERGAFVPREPENWDPAAVWKDLRYRTAERWLDEDDIEFQPYMHYGVGGNSKFWGSVLYRLRKEDFDAVDHAGGLSPAWPIDYAALEPYYDRAERLYHVHGQADRDPTDPPRGPFPYPAVPHGPEIARIEEQLREQGLHPSPLPLGLIRPGEPGGCLLCNTCNSFPCQHDVKSDADVCCVRPALQQGNVALWTGAHARRLITDPSGRKVTAVEIEREGDLVRVEAPVFVVSCGAVNSAALLLRSATDKHPAGLANSSGLVGRRYMAHLATMMQGFHPFKVNQTVFQKTLAVNDFYLQGPDAPYPLGHLQTQGRTHGIMAKLVGDTDPQYMLLRDIPVWVYDAWVARGVDWLAMSEDLPDPDNRVMLDSDGRIRLVYRANNLLAHEQLVNAAKRMLRRLGFWKVMAFSHQERNTTHQCGTLCFGTDPRHSVLDPFCRAHDVANLFVVDASFFPSSAAVNPALTIIAQALRVADHIAETELRRPMETAGAATQS
jgi:choline dehydrogenase-like flavoprotein